MILFLGISHRWKVQAFCYLPVQGSKLQLILSTVSPQGIPPYSGCLMICRILVFNPFPHVALHRPHGLQVVIWQSSSTQKVHQEFMRRYTGLKSNFNLVGLRKPSK